MKVSTVIIFTSEPFPMGMAGTNRIISYAKGFLFHQKEVKIVCLRKTEQKDDIKNKNTTGIYEGIKFRYLTHDTVKTRSFINKRIDDIRVYISLIFWGIKHLNSGTLSIYYSFHTVPVLILKFLTRIKGGVLLKEENEHPSVRMRLKNSVEKTLFKKLHYNLFDGFLLITDALMKYFKESHYGNKPMLLVPMMIDVERFSTENDMIKMKKEIVYCGEITIGKDGIDILIKAFKNISDIFGDYHLSLYGVGPKNEEIEILSLVKEFRLEDRITFYGLVNRNVITEKILEAGILVMPRPDSIQARHGFSTKLGEYLATGNPIVATRVGEIPKYLTDNENVFFAKPGDVDSLTERLKYIIENYNSAKKVAIKGRDYAMDHFSNIRQTGSVLAFVEHTF